VGAVDAQEKDGEQWGKSEGGVVMAVVRGEGGRPAGLQDCDDGATGDKWTGEEGRAACVSRRPPVGSAAVCACVRTCVVEGCRVVSAGPARNGADACRLLNSSRSSTRQVNQ